MGYLIAAVLFVMLLVVVATTIRPGVNATGGDTEKPHPVGPTEPAADEPTPGASRTASPAAAERAQEHLPPA